MSPLKEIPFGAHVAWCPSSRHKTLLAVGRPGYTTAVDFVDIDLADGSRRAFKTPASVYLPEGSSLTALAWASSGANLENVASSGLLAVGLESGIVKIWNPDVYLQQNESNSDGDSTTHNMPSHLREEGGILASCQSSSEAVTCVEFNTTSSSSSSATPSFIACGHADGSLNIINLDNIEAPEIYEVGPDPPRAHGNKPVTAAAWNSGVPHILASTCSSGITAIWNLKQRKASIKFRDPAGRQKTSSVAWVPNQATQVIVTYDDDANPSLQMWDLRNTSYPFKEFPGHSRGIVGIRVSNIDPSLFLTCGKDNRTVCWAVQESSPVPTIYSEIATAEWQSAVRWAPCLPGLFASTSTIGGVTIDSVQERRNPSTKYVPRWFQRPAGCSFGFGGKLAIFNSALGSGVRVDIIPTTETDLIAQADEFEMTLVNNDFLGYCDKKIQETEDDHERLTWQVVQTLFYHPDTRGAALLERLGFRAQAIEQAIEMFLGHKPGALFTNPETFSLPASLQPYGDHSIISGTIGTGLTHSDIPHHTALYDGIPPQMSQGPVDAESFFNDLGNKDGDDVTTANDGILWDDSNNNLTGQSTHNVQQPLDAATTTALPVEERVLSTRFDSNATTAGGNAAESRDWNSQPDSLIKTSFLIGQRSLATEVCIESGRWADALLLAATSGDNDLWEQTKNIYIQRRSHDKFLQMISCVIAQRWPDLVQLADLTKWEETLALLASYVPSNEFATLSEALGKRLETEMFDIRAAVVCYLTAGSFKLAAQVWSSLAFSNSRGKSLQKSLQDLVEKLTILKKATQFQEPDPLFNQKVSQYAELLANSGRLVAGMKFLCLVGQDTTDSTTTNILRHRIYNSSPEAMQKAGIPPPQGLPFISVDVRAAIPPIQQQQQQQQQTSIYNSLQQGQHTMMPSSHPNSYLPPPSQQGPSGRFPSGPPQAPNTYQYQGSSPPMMYSAHQHVPGYPQPPPPPPPSAPDTITPHKYPPPTPQSQTYGVATRPPSTNVWGDSSNRQQLTGMSAAGMQSDLYNITRTASVGSIASSSGPQASRGGLPPPALPTTTSFQQQPYSSIVPPSITPYGTASSMRPPMTSAVARTQPSTVPSLVPTSTPMTSFAPVAPMPTSFPPPPTTATSMSPSGLSRPSHGPVTSYPGPTESSISNSVRPLGATDTYSSEDSTRGPQQHMIQKSTAPTAAVTRIPPGMPVPWPIPTGTQQVGSNTQSTAPANQKIHAILDTTKTEGIPMAASELAIVQRVLFHALDEQVHHDPHNTRKHEDIRTKLGELLTQLQNGALNKTTQGELLQFCKALEIGDYVTANQIQGQLTRTSWSKESRNWLTALKRLLAK